MKLIQGAAAYIAIIFALYGFRDNGFADSKQEAQVDAVIQRKNAAGQKGTDAKKQYYAQLRTQRLRSVDPERFGTTDPEFAKTYSEKQWVR
jgi:hypothetical protein